MEKSDILAPMNKQMLELFSGRAGSEGVTASMEGLIEGEEDKKKRKKEQKARDAAEGKRHGKMHDLKETLGIDYGLKKGPRSASMLMWPPTIGDDWRVKWS